MKEVWLLWNTRYYCDYSRKAVHSVWFNMDEAAAFCQKLEAETEFDEIFWLEKREVK